MPRKGLDILQQKSWHVLRRHNIEKVRKDQREEKELQEKEKEREERALFQSQIETLRKRTNNESELPKESINLFKIDDLKELKNIDKEKEDIEEADVQARKDGLLNYVGETVLEGGDPWYARARNRQMEEEAEARIKDDIRKLKEDPFEAKFKSKMEWTKEKRQKSSIENPERLPELKMPKINLSDSDSDEKHKKTKKSKKSKKLKKSKKSKSRKSDRQRSRSRSRSSSRSRSPEIRKTEKLISGAPSMDELRKRKQKREEREKLKTQELMDKVNGVVKKPVVIEEEQDERKRTYNNAFNPKLNNLNKRRF